MRQYKSGMPLLMTTKTGSKRPFRSVFFLLSFFLKHVLNLFTLVFHPIYFIRNSKIKKQKTVWFFVCCLKAIKTEI